MKYLDMATPSQRNLLLFCTDISLFFEMPLKSGPDCVLHIQTSIE